MVKTLTLLGLSLLVSACTTVRTYDREGNMTGMCRVTGLMRKGGQCVGYANDAAYVRKAAVATKPEWDGEVK